jgi:putative ABC transport system permease protein
MMSWGETIRTALHALNARRMRSLLTVLGILIGISAVILTVGLGEGAQKSITDQINSLGSNLLIVTPSAGTSSSGIRGGGSSATSLTLQDAAMLANKAIAPDVQGVAPVSTTQGTVQSGDTTWTSSIVGATPEWTTVRAQTVETGRFFTQSDANANTPVAVLGSTVVTQLFGTSNPVGQTIQISGSDFAVVGVLKSSGSSTGVDQDNQVVIPLSVYSSRLSSSAGAGSLSTVYLQATSSKTLSAAYQEASNALLNAHRVTAANQDFTLSSYASLVSVATTLTNVLTALLGGIAGISLLVGGIGVMNIMLVSVSERVREIGLRKALGATPSVIRRQFLVEAAILGLLGGVLGWGLGATGPAILTPVLQIPVTISWVATALALGVSLAIGLIAGVYPASRAANLAPIDALRSE